MGTFDQFSDDSIQSRTQSNANMALQFGVDSNPDQAAQNMALAKRYNLPVSVVEHAPDEFHSRAKADDARAGMGNSERLAAWLAENPDHAKVAHDDVKTLSGIEGLLNFGGSLVGGASFDLSSGVYGLGELGAEIVKPWVGLATHAIGVDNPLDAISGTLKEIRMGQHNMAERLAGDTSQYGELGQGIISGARSMGNMLPGIAATIATKNPNYMLGMGAGLQGSQSASKALDEDAGVGKAAYLGSVDAAAEYLGEKIGLSYFLKDLKAGSSLFKTLGRQIALEVPSEMATTAWQDFNDWAILHPEKSFDDYKAQLAPDERQTVIATITQTLMTVGLGKGIHHLAHRAEQKQQQAAQADADHQTLSKLIELATASKLHGRDADTFEQFVQHASEDGPVQDVYVDANVLHQSGQVEQLAAVSPAVREQYATALATGGTVRIPLAEYTARIAGTEYNQGLLEHLKTDPNGMSKAEADAYLHAQAEEAHAELSQALATQQGDDTFKASHEAVKQDVLAQLNNAGRFSATKNEVDATLYAARTAVRAAQQGITPEELHQKQMLKIRAEGADGQVLNQGGTHPTDMPAFKNWFGDSKVVDADGKPLVVYHGTNASFSEFSYSVPQKTRGSKTHWMGFFFANNPKFADRFTMGSSNGANIMPLYIKIENPYFAKQDDIERYDSNTDEQNDLESVALEDQGYDGIIIRVDGAHDEYVAFRPDQIKSSIGNNGEFNPNDANILHQSARTEVSGKRFARQVLEEFTAENDAAFVHPISQSQDIGTILNEIAKAEYHGEHTREDERSESSADRRYVFTAASGEMFYVYETDAGKVWLDVSKLNGDGEGQAIYAAVANYAYNTHKIFTGDPAGVSDAATIRRTSNMLSSALRFGTTRHLEASREQIKGDPDNGIEPLKWQGSDIDKIESLIHSFVATSFKSAPELEEYHYDFSTANFSTAQGRPITGVALASNLPRDARIGEKSARRAVFLKSLVSSSSEGIGGRGGILENILRWGNTSPPQSLSKLFQSQDSNRGAFSPDTNTITLLANADLSTFQHELGHYFFENDIALAMDLQHQAEMFGEAALKEGERAIVSDVSVWLNAVGIQGTLPDQLRQWTGMDFEEKRARHEQSAEMFEAYLFSGKAPSIELQKVFQTLRAWMLNVYQSLKNFLAGHPEAGKLNDDVRAVFDRMLATTEQIQLAEQSRSMMPLFESALLAGMSPEAYADYHHQGVDATQEAIQALQARGLRDMQWMHNARGREIKKLQKQSEALRQQMRMDVRKEVMSQPVYRAWQFLTAKLQAEDKHAPLAPRKSDPNVLDERQDSLFVAIAKLGGLNKAQVQATWGIDAEDKPTSGVFGKPVWRVEGGLSPDAMAESLGQYGYLTKDQHGKVDLHELAEKFSAELGGDSQYSHHFEPDQYDAMRAGDQVNNLGSLGAGRLDSSALREMFGAPSSDIKNVEISEPEEQYQLFTKDDNYELPGTKRSNRVSNSRKARDIHAASSVQLEESTARNGLYFVTAKLEKVGERLLPAKITSVQEAADATVYLSNYAVEHFDAIVTDKNGKPLAIIGSFKGTPTSAAVYPGTIAMELAKIKDAAHVWASHNHPSGTSRLSDADRSLSTNIAELLRDSGIEYHGLIAIAGDQYSSTTQESGAISRNKQAMLNVSVVERVLEGSPKKDLEVSSAIKAKSIVRELAKDKTGIVFLSAGNAPTSFVPFSPEELGELRKDDRLLALFNAAAHSGAVKAIIANPNKGMTTQQIQNAGTALKAIDISLLDAINYDAKNLDEPAKSAAELGYSLYSLNGKFFQSQSGSNQPTENPADIVARLTALGMTAPDGLHPDIVAEVLGDFGSGDELVRALAAAQDPKALIEQLTDQRMLEAHGDLATPEAISIAADQAIHNRARQRVISTELNALDQALGNRKLLESVAREFAAKTIAAQQVKDLRPAQYAAAAARAAKASAKAFKAGDVKVAAAEKRNELLNHLLADEAYRAKDEVDSALAYFKKVSVAGKIPATHFEQIVALLSKFDLRKSVTNTALDNAAKFRTWAKAQLASGNIPPNVENLLSPEQRKAYAGELARRTEPAEGEEEGDLIYANEEDQALLLAGFIDDIPVRSYKAVSVEELRGLRDTIGQIEHIGRRTKQILTDRKNREFKAVVNEIRERIESVAKARGRVSNDTRTANDTAGQLRATWRGFFFSHVKAANLLHIMDGGEGGPLWEHLMKTANDAANGEVEDIAKAHDTVQALLKTLKNVGDITDRPQYFKSINRSLNRQARIVMALNMGNESNMQRLLGGEGWTLAQIKPVLDTLTSTDWHFVQGMWDYYETFRPRVGEMEKRINGIEPEWVEARTLQVHTADNQVLNLRGGYAPVIFDPKGSGKAASFAAEKDAKAMMQAARVASSVNKSFTKTRVEEVKGRPLLLSLDAMIGSIQDTVHYLHWQPWIIDANRMIKALDAPIREHYGAEVVKTLREWAGDNAAGMRPARNGAERAVTNLARNVSYAGLAFNVLSAVKQVTGYSQSAAIIGGKWMARGVARTVANPRTAFLDATDKSAFLRKRATTRMRDLAEVNGTIQDQGVVRHVLDKSGYAMMMAMQSAVDVPTWWGAYEKHIDAGKTEEMAVALADQAVIDAQGSGLGKDLASVERATGAIRLLTGFMSYMNTTMNVNYRVLKSDQSIGAKAVDLVLINAIPVMMGMMLSILLVPSGGDGDDEETLLKKYLAEQTNFMLGQFIGSREIAQLGSAALGLPGSDYGGAVGMRLYGDILKVAKQAGQGDMDDSLRKAVVNAAGDIFRLPSAQINKSITGLEALNDDATDNPTAIAFGFNKH